jgi:hypothetical protein
MNGKKLLAMLLLFGAFFVGQSVYAHEYDGADEYGYDNYEDDPYDGIDPNCWAPEFGMDVDGNNPDTFDWDGYYDWCDENGIDPGNGYLDFDSYGDFWDWVNSVGDDSSGSGEGNPWEYPLSGDGETDGDDYISRGGGNSGGNTSGTPSTNPSPSSSNNAGVSPTRNLNNIARLSNGVIYPRTFNLPTGSNGVLVQQMTITLPNGSTQTYYEAWQITGGASPTDSWAILDRNGTPFPNGSQVTFTGVVQFYPNATLDANFPDMQPNTVSAAGGLPSSVNPPTNWNNEGAVSETITVTFNGSGVGGVIDMPYPIY